MAGRGETVELVVESTAYRGAGVARLDGLVVFVRHGLPGDRLRARIVRRKSSFAEAVVEELVEPSPLRQEPRCPYFGVCGGCTWQNAAYPEQLEFKRRQVEEIFHRLGGLQGPGIRPTLGAPQPFGYRNKMEFTFGARRWLTREEIESGRDPGKDFALGLHVPRRWDKVLDLEECHLMDPIGPAIVNRVREAALEQGWSAWDVRRHAGYLRNLILRVSHRSNEVMVNLVTSRSEPGRLELLSRRLTDGHPRIATVVNTIHAGPSPTPPGDEIHVYRGRGRIEDQLGPFRFEIAPLTFFQPNTAQAEKLCETVLEMAGLSGRERVWDLYSGAGGLSFYLAREARSVTGFESQPEAVEGARRNAGLNDIANCSFRCGDVLELIGQESLPGSADLVVTDPPRAGMHPDVCRGILNVAPRRVIYVSCNPSTQARDLKILDAAYSIEAVQPLDMFPQTCHIENVVSLRRRGE